MKNYNKSTFAPLIAAIFIAGAISLSPIKAQDTDPKAHIGVKGALMVTNLIKAGDNVTENNLKLGGAAGIFIKLPVLGILSIQPELLYLSKGSTTSYNFGTGNITPGAGQLSFNLNYIELPILAVINVTRYINIHAGPYAAFLVNANVKNKSDNKLFDSYDDLNADNFQRIDYGISGGIGLDFRPFIAGIRYDGSLRNLGKSGLSGAITQEARNSALQIYLGVGF